MHPNLVYEYQKICLGELKMENESLRNLCVFFAFCFICLFVLFVLFLFCFVLFFVLFCFLFCFGFFGKAMNVFSKSKFCLPFMVFEFVNKVKMESLAIERKPNAGNTCTDMGKMYARRLAFRAGAQLHYLGRSVFGVPVLTSVTNIKISCCWKTKPKLSLKIKKGNTSALCMMQYRKIMIKLCKDGSRISS